MIVSLTKPCVFPKGFGGGNGIKKKGAKSYGR